MGEKYSQKRVTSLRVTETRRPSAPRKKWIGAAALALIAVGITLWKLDGFGHAQAAKVTFSPPAPAFGPTVENHIPPPATAPEGMAWIPGGEFSMGAQDAPDMNDAAMHATADSRPIHRVYVDGFWMDKSDVTNEEFEKFVKATRYVTIAERTPRAEDFPGAPPENLVAGSVVFTPTPDAV